jgi:hypothetical protein
MAVALRRVRNGRSPIMAISPRRLEFYVYIFVIINCYILLRCGTYIASSNIGRGMKKRKVMRSIYHKYSYIHTIT